MRMLVETVRDTQTDASCGCAKGMCKGMCREAGTWKSVYYNDKQPTTQKKNRTHLSG